MNRRGVSLVETLVALVVGLVLISLAVRTDLALTRVLRGRAERAGSAANLQRILAATRDELGRLGSDPVAGGDVGVLAPGRIGYRAQRGLLRLCHSGPDTAVVATDLADWRARLPDPARDSLLLFTADTAGGAGGWLPAGIAGGGAASCPDGSPGFGYHLATDTAALGAAVPHVARLVEGAALAAYGGPAWTFGFEAVSSGAVIQPVAGPLDGPGFGIRLFDRTGAWIVAIGIAAGAELMVRTAGHREVAVGPGSVPGSADSLRAAIHFEGVP